ncbi:MAG: NUDIX hydrolase [Pikeienuella sp.]
MIDQVPTPRDASTIVIVRNDSRSPQVLMGQRGASASFMPSKFVFPGGALDPADQSLAGAFAAHSDDISRLTAHSPTTIQPAALALAAIRETWEETGLAIGAPDGASTSLESDDEHWQSFFAAGLSPQLNQLRFIFRAVTPPTRSKRFDARFFMTDAAAIHHDLDDFSRASGELSHLSWLTLSEARSMDLPFITEVVLAEVESRLRSADRSHPTPFFHHKDGRSFMDHL